MTTTTYTVCRVDENNLTIYTPEQLNKQADEWINDGQICDSCGWYCLKNVGAVTPMSRCKYGCGDNTLITPTRRDFDLNFPHGIQPFTSFLLQAAKKVHGE